LRLLDGMEPRDLGAAIDACRPTSIGVVATIVVVATLEGRGYVGRRSRPRSDVR